MQQTGHFPIFYFYTIIYYIFFFCFVFFCFFKRKKVLERCGIPDKPICFLGINRQAVFTSFLELFHIHFWTLFVFTQKSNLGVFWRQGWPAWQLIKSIDRKTAIKVNIHYKVFNVSARDKRVMSGFAFLASLNSRISFGAVVEHSVHSEVSIWRFSMFSAGLRLFFSTGKVNSCCYST